MESCSHQMNVPARRASTYLGQDAVVDLQLLRLQLGPGVCAPGLWSCGAPRTEGTAHEKGPEGIHDEAQRRDEEERSVISQRQPLGGLHPVRTRGLLRPCHPFMASVRSDGQPGSAGAGRRRTGGGRSWTASTRLQTPEFTRFTPGGLWLLHPV